MPIRKRSEIESVLWSEMKRCPFCDNEIRVKAVKCQYCWEYLDKQVNNVKPSDNRNTYSWQKWFFASMWDSFKEGFNAGRGGTGSFIL